MPPQKVSDGRFNHVDPDHSEEGLNGTWTRAGGIVAITKNTFPALSRWALSYNLRSQIETRKMFGLDDQVETNLSFQML